MTQANDTIRHVLVETRRSRNGTEHLGRALDWAVALGALVFLGPLMLFTALFIAAERSGPVLFAHTRIGLGGDTFKVLKFRTMRSDGDHILAAHLKASPEAAAEWERNHKLRDDPRVSRLGNFLRKASLDELPQLFNVLRGEMSIVGPRPIVQAEIARYGKFFKAYCSVRPGMTGIWQVSGRSDVSYRRRVVMDALYARKKSVILDLKIISATIPAVLARKGSY